MWMWWFDRDGAIQSFGLNFIADFHLFVALLAILQRFDKVAWGFDSTFRPYKGDDTMEQGTVDVTVLGPPQSPGDERPKVKISLRPGDTPLALNLFTHSSSVVPITRSAGVLLYDGKPLDPSTELVAKIYHPSENRDSEADILALAYKVAAGRDEDATAVRGHLPILVAGNTWEDDTAELIQKVMGIAKKENKRRSRKLRVLVFLKLSPIWELSGSSFMKVFRDCFSCTCDASLLFARASLQALRPWRSLEAWASSSRYQRGESDVREDRGPLRRRSQRL
jgi:hypothetical protein